MDIPARYFRFLRSGDARPLEPVLEHNRLDLISLAAVTAHAVQLVEEGMPRCRDAAEALALGKVYERAGCVERAIACYQHAAADPSAHVDVVLEAIYRLGLRFRRDRRYADAADCWRRLLDMKQGRFGTAERAPRAAASVRGRGARHSSRTPRAGLRGREGADAAPAGRVRRRQLRTKAEATRHRLARLEKKIAKRNDNHLFA